MFSSPIGGRKTVIATMVGLVVVLVLVVFLLLWLICPPLAQTFLVLVVLALGYAHAVEPFWVDFQMVSVGIRGMPRIWEGTRVVLLSDLHLGFAASAGWLRRVFAQVLEHRPDLIVLTGDLFAGGTRGIPKEAAELAALTAPLGTFAVLGNHDYFAQTSAVRQALEDARIILLSNQAIPLQREGERLWLAGVDDLGTGHDDLEETLRAIPDGETTILLCHNPDLVEEVSEHQVPLMLSGHTHGGQVCLPFLGPVYCFSRFYRRYAAGLFQVGPTSLYVNRGLGKALLP
ncbi:MAG: metallophosphoesterase, partial [Burkholderiales bacterium]|nr:metallophosphoesterase [Burkholderiales bacterium]